jgi:outer membrane biosynthesis protein TonB
MASVASPAAIESIYDLAVLGFEKAFANKTSAANADEPTATEEKQKKKKKKPKKTVKKPKKTLTKKKKKPSQKSTKLREINRQKLPWR